MNFILRFTLLALLVAGFALPAHAYLDPGSGSMILQVIAGGVAGAVVAFKMFWHRIYAFFAGTKTQHDEPPV